MSGALIGALALCAGTCTLSHASTLALAPPPGTWPLSQAAPGFIAGASAEEQSTAVAALIGRTLPDHSAAASKFSLLIVASCAPPDKRSCFTVQAGLANAGTPVVLPGQSTAGILDPLFLKF